MKSEQEEHEDRQTASYIVMWLRKQAKKGGDANTPAQQEARLENLKKAQKARQNKS